MPGIPKDWQTYAAFRDDVFIPFLEAERYVEMGEASETYLVTEKDSAIQSRIISEIAVFIDIPGHEDVAFHWSERPCEEFKDSPFAWCRTGERYRAPRQKTPANNRVACGHYETGLGNAPAAEQWVRYVPVARHHGRLERPRNPHTGDHFGFSGGAGARRLISQGRLTSRYSRRGH